MSNKNLSGIYQLSLLAPDSSEEYFTVSDNTINDLSVDFLADSISYNSSEKTIITKILARMPASEKIINYRSAVYSELREDPALCQSLFEVFDAMRFHMNDHAVQHDENATIWDFLTRLRSLENYISSILQIKELIDNRSFRSDGLQQFAKYIKAIYEGSGFEELAKDISDIGKDFETIHSMTIGVNFDENFYPSEVGIVSLNKYYYEEQSLLQRFMKFHRKDQLNDNKELRQFTMEMHKEGLDRITKKFGRSVNSSRPTDSPLMNNLNCIIERMLPSMTNKLKRILNKYIDVSGRALADLADEFLFYLRFIELEKEMSDTGLPCCIGNSSENDTLLSDLYNIKLAICHANGTVSEKIVCNDIRFTKDTNVQILTGPNRGGKTILTQAVGLAFLMYQSGVFVPASKAEIRLCSGIYSHFPVEEERTVSLGRLGEEAARFNEICKTADSNSLILFNESFATTSHTESLYIAEDVIKYLCRLGSRSFFNTHMHELAANAEQFGKAENAVCKAVSVVMENDNGKRSYKISYKKPDGKSYAHEIACQYGITYEQLCQHLNK